MSPDSTLGCQNPPVPGGFRHLRVLLESRAGVISGVYIRMSLMIEIPYP